MEQEHLKYPIRRKPPTKSISRLPKKRINNPFPSPLDPEDRKYLSEREAERNIGQNISLIAKKQEGSFISNRQDQSLDSFDKMIMGVDEELDIEVQNTSNSKENDPNYTLLYQQFERLVKHRQDSAEAEGSSILQGEKDERETEEIALNILKEEAGSSSILREQFSQGQQGGSGSNMKMLKERLQQIKDIRKQKLSQSSSDPNISLRLLGANLSQIHEQQIQHSSMHRMDPIEEEFIDFVSKNEAGKVNISNIQRNNISNIERHTKQQLPPSSALKNDLNTSIKEPEEDEVVAMLENELGSRRENLIEEESLEQSDKKQGQQQFFEKENYHQILRELDENEDKKLDNSHLNVSGLLSKREEWVNKRTDRSQRWKSRELQLISKIRQIIFNPYADFSDEEDFNLSL